MSEKQIAFGKPFINNQEVDLVGEVMQSGWLAHGPKTKEFEAVFAEYCNAKHAVSVNSCTAALHLSYMSMEIGPGDEVIVPAMTHVATAHAVEYTGAKAVFADVDLDTYNINIDSIESKINSRTKAISPVHFAGQPVNLDAIFALAKKHGLHVVEDAAHAPGAEYKGRTIGSMEESYSTCFSFYPVKHITTGEGGMFVTNNPKVAEKATLLRAFGIDRSTFARTTTERPWHYEVHGFGTNYRSTEISAAMGLVQMTKLEGIHAHRTQRAKEYRELLKGVEGVTLPFEADHVNQTYLFMQVLINDKSALERNDLIPKLKALGIGTSVHYPVPVNLMPAYGNKYGYQKGECPNAELISAQALSLPLGPHVEADDVAYICDHLQKLTS